MLQNSHSKVLLEKGALLCQKTADSIGAYEAGYSAPHIARYSLLKMDVEFTFENRHRIHFGGYHSM